MANFDFYKKEYLRLRLELEKIGNMPDSDGEEMKKAAIKALSYAAEYPEDKYLCGWGKGKDE